MTAPAERILGIVAQRQGKIGLSDRVLTTWPPQHVLDHEAPPWRRGHQLAQATRATLGVDPEDRFDVSPWVGVREVSDGVSGLPCAQPR
jgi:hypothetical protein